MALSTEKRWSCTECTYANHPSASHCTMCNAARNSKYDTPIDRRRGEWECNSCKTRNSSSSNKCTACYTRRHPIFSPTDIDDINRYVSSSNQPNITYTHNNNRHQSNSAPNPSLISMKHNNNNRYTNKKAEIFDIYTNKKKALLPIDIQLNSGMKPKLTGPTIKIHYDDDFNLSTSPSPSISSISSHNFDSISNYHMRNDMNSRDRNSSLNSNAHFSSSPEPMPVSVPMLDLNNNRMISSTVTSSGKSKPKLGLMGKMVRKYSDPEDESITTTLLITPKNKVDDKYNINILRDNMNIMDSKIIDILKKRHNNDDYYAYIVKKTQGIDKGRKNDLINSPSNNDERVKYPILKCVSCDSRMIHTKCPINDRNHEMVQCYSCDIAIYTLGMEYYHCPNVKMAEHKDIGRDLCCICGVKMMMKQDKHNINMSDNNMQYKGMSVDEQMILYENYLKYQTYKFEEMIPSILMMTSLDDFEYIYNEIHKQTLSLSEYINIINILDNESIYLNGEINKIGMDISKSKSNKNDIKAECTAISNDINRVSLEISALMKKINVLSKKKSDLQSQMQSILNVLSTMNTHEHNLEIISSKTYLYKEKIDQRIKYIGDYNHKVNILHSILNEKRKTLFGKYQLWNTKQCISQLKHYLHSNNDIKLNNLKLIIKQFNNRDIKGKDLINLNELTFKMMAINDSYDQKILLLWINHVINGNNNTQQKQTQKHYNNPNKKPNKQTQTPPPINLNNNQIEEEDNDCKMELSSGNSPSIASINTNQSSINTKNNSLLCAICMVNNVNVILNPCGHICICDSCSFKIKQICPVCRIEISEIKHCFFASR